MPPKSSETFPLSQRVEALNLPPTRKAVIKSAHAMTKQDSANAGFITHEFDNVFVATFGVGKTRAIVAKLTEDVMYMHAMSKGPNFDKAEETRQKLKPILLKYQEPKGDALNRVDGPDFFNSVLLGLAASQQATDEAEQEPHDHDEDDQLDEGKDIRKLVFIVDADTAVKIEQQGGRVFLEPQGSKLPDDVSEAEYNERESWGDYLRLVVNHEAGSEQSVQQVVGAASRKVLILEKCLQTCDEEVTFPRVLQMSFGRNPHPDLASRAEVPNSETEYKNVDPRCMAPVVAAGEAKLRKDRDGPKSPSAASQLQAAVYPTLLILALIFEELYPRGSRVRRATNIPDDFIVYGLYYDKFEIKIYAHFPILTAQGKDKVDSWRFVQVLMATYQVPKDRNSPMAPSVELAVGMHVMRAQAVRLRDVFHKRCTEAWKKIFAIGCQELRDEALKKAKEKAEEPARLKAELQVVESEIETLKKKLSDLKVKESRSKSSKTKEELRADMEELEYTKAEKLVDKKELKKKLYKMSN